MPLEEYRENPKRGVFVHTNIDNLLVNQIAPQIIGLRADGASPITVYIDSLGGSTFHAQKIIDLLETPTQDGSKCKTITVAYGFAASAAADLLALGDYAIAYPTSIIHYHGTRQRHSEITVDNIDTIATTLQHQNEQFAMRLASRMLRRLVF